MSRPHPACALLLSLLLPACEESTAETTPCEEVGTTTGPLLEASCDPLVPTQCGFPFPSSVWLVDDPTTPSGRRVAFGPKTLPVFVDAPLDPALWSKSDGFSAGQAPMTDLRGATAEGFPTPSTIERSLEADSPTILLDAETGERVPHFAEVDQSTAAHDGDRALMIRPVVRLRDGARYIVALRHVVGEDGKVLAPSPAFQALRDCGESSEPSVARRRTLYADIFAKLEAAGIARGDLQLAWDYWTASRESNTGWMVHMRDDALAIVGEEGPTYVVDEVVENPNPHLRRRILGRMTVPLYLDKPGVGGRLVFGDDGLPRQNGTAEYPFLVLVPNSVTTGTPGALLQNGHGMLGLKTEGQDGYLAELADKKQFVAFAVDFIGFADEDYDQVKTSITEDLDLFAAAVERQHQGMVNSLLAMRMMKGRFWKDPSVQFGGASAIDPTECYYRGDSQGGIYGTSYMALSTDVTRGLLGEPGMPYNLLLNRSVDFEPFFDAVKYTFGSGLKVQIGLALVQMWWDRTDPSGYAPYITGNLLPGTPPHEVLIHVAIGDYQVTPLGAHILARTVGARNLAPVNRSIFGLEEADGPFEGSGMVEFDFGLPEAPETNNPPSGPEEDDPHDKVRVLDVAHDQTDVFLRTGKITQTCSGPCDPE